MCVLKKLINKGILMSDFTNTIEMRFKTILNINKILFKTKYNLAQVTIQHSERVLNTM